jgi:predicted dinucleotide-binding enzyme
LIGVGDTDVAVAGDVVVLAVPYSAVAGVIAHRGEQLAGKIVVDITNPLNFETFDSLVVPRTAPRPPRLLPRSRTARS